MLLILLLLLIGIFILVESQVKRIKREQLSKYSYKTVFVMYSRCFYVIPLISTLLYKIYDSAEIAVTFGIYMLFCSFAGALIALLYTYQGKRRGL